MALLGQFWRADDISGALPGRASRSRGLRLLLTVAARFYWLSAANERWQCGDAPSNKTALCGRLPQQVLIKLPDEGGTTAAAARGSDRR